MYIYDIIVLLGVTFIRWNSTVLIIGTYIY